MSKAYPNYGPFYNYFGSHVAVENFMFEFHSIGEREFPLIQKGDDFDKVRSLYDFWIGKGFLTQKQIAFAGNLINKIENKETRYYKKEEEL